MRRALLIAALCALWGCPDDLEKQSHVSKLRVLGVRAEPAELILAQGAPLPATTLTALAVEPSGVPVETHFSLCTRLGDAPPGDLACPGTAGIDLPDAGPEAARLDLSDPRIVAFAASVQLDGGAIDAGGLAQQLSQGVPLLVGFESTAPAFGNPDGGPAGGADGLQHLQGFAAITLRTAERGPANLNPELIGLRLVNAPDGGFDYDPGPEVPADGGLVVPTGAVLRLTPVSAPKDDATKKYGYSFFVTGGSLGALRSVDITATGQPGDIWVQWSTPLDPQPVRLWVVVRDGRGGTAWLERVVQVR